MEDIREKTTTGNISENKKKHMKLFWEAYDKLWVDMEHLTQEEYFVRNEEMWEHAERASDVDGDYEIVSLYDLSQKYKEQYGM